MSGTFDIEEVVRRLSNVDRDRTHPNVRPRDAATLIVLDRAAGGPWRMLMGRRHMRHRFMPGTYVFPGGGIEAGDRHASLASPLRPDVADKLLRGQGSRATAARSRALAVAALRETYEETGIIIGRAASGPRPLPGFADAAALPDLAQLALLAQAITPPGRPRRFNARFFACFAADIVAAPAQGAGPSGELEDVAWLSVTDTTALPLPSITQTMIAELMHRLESDPRLRAAAAVPYYHWRGNRYERLLID